MCTPRSHCYICKLPVDQCICDNEDFEDDDETLDDIKEWENENEFYEEPTDGFGRNYSDADPGL